MRIGRYEVCGLLGRGGMGAVYKVRQPVTGRIAALKLLRPADTLADLSDMDDLRRRFLHEAQVMAALDHPHVAAVWDVDVAPAGTLRLPMPGAGERGLWRPPGMRETRTPPPRRIATRRVIAPPAWPASAICRSSSWNTTA